MKPPEWSRQNEAAKGGGLTCDHAGWRIAIAILILIGNGNGNGEQLRPLKALLDITLGYHSWALLWALLWPHCRRQIIKDTDHERLCQI